MRLVLDILRGTLEARVEERQRAVEYAERAEKDVRTWRNREKVLTDQINELEDFLAGAVLQEIEP